MGGNAWFLSVLRGLLSGEPISVEVHETGLVLSERHGLSVYDAMIAASGLFAGCVVLGGYARRARRERRGPDD